MSALNIKNEEAVRLVRELAELEGESMTTVVIEAVREKLDRTRNPESSAARVQYWIGVGAVSYTHLTLPTIYSV